MVLIKNPNKRQTKVHQMTETKLPDDHPGISGDVCHMT